MRIALARFNKGSLKPAPTTQPMAQRLADLLPSRKTLLNTTIWRRAVAAPF
ncbi:hypothetical protein [Kingella oralis]|uniref:hypothetical protein n=1 Tax=Kingella oralis TaxID=505 RepID=UPI0034E5BFB2